MKLLLLSLFLFAGCLTQTAEELKNGNEYTGIDINGEQRTCKEQLNGACTAVFGPDEQFANDCEATGSRAVQCACHDFICVGDKARTGVDINGEEKSCIPMGENNFCTTEFTQGDQFAQDCRANGLEAVQCGCHEYICVE